MDRDHGPQFLIGENHWEVVNQQFNGYPVESGCEDVQESCSDSMLLYDCAELNFVIINLNMHLKDMTVMLIMGLSRL